MAEIVLERFVNIKDSISKDSNYEVIFSISSRHVQVLCSTAVYFLDVVWTVEMGSIM